MCALCALLSALCALLLLPAACCLLHILLIDPDPTSHTDLYGLWIIPKNRSIDQQVFYIFNFYETQVRSPASFKTPNSKRDFWKFKTQKTKNRVSFLSFVWLTVIIHTSVWLLVLQYIRAVFIWPTFTSEQSIMLNCPIWIPILWKKTIVPTVLPPMRMSVEGEFRYILNKGVWSCEQLSGN